MAKKTKKAVKKSKTFKAAKTKTALKKTTAEKVSCEKEFYIRASRVDICGDQRAEGAHQTKYTNSADCIQAQPIGGLSIQQS
jgi:hypothetical protein